jgi:kynurenine formamidase
VNHPPFPVHKVFLKNEVLVFENLANLAALAGKELEVYALPTRLGVDGAPVGVMAETI